MESDMRTTALCNLVADDATYVHAHWLPSLPSYGCASADTIDTFHSTFTQQSHYNHT